jgi:uncharacterized protein (DUF1697 family)
MGSTTMVCVALLRGVNVGGKNKVEMARLKEVFVTVGFGDVRTFINSGNVVFTADQRGTEVIATEIEKAIEKEFGFEVKVLVKDADEMTAITAAIPENWVDDKTMRTYVMFLWTGLDASAIVDDLPLKDGIDNVIHVPGAIIWQVERRHVTKSGMNRMASGPVYKSMTVRNANTVRKLTTMVAELID